MEELNLMEIFKQRQLLHPSLPTEALLLNDGIYYSALMMMVMKAMSWKS